MASAAPGPLGWLGASTSSHAGSATGRRRRLLAYLLIVGLLPVAPAGGVDPATDTSICTYPLGNPAEERELPRLSTGDVEHAIVDGSFKHATKTILSIVPLWGTYHSVVDGRYRLADGGNRHNIIYKAWGPHGWNSTTYYPSNSNVSVAAPEGRPNATLLGSALEPRAFAYKDKLWVAWEAQEQPFSNNPGSAILLRSLDSSGNWSGVLEVTEPYWTTVNRGVDMIVYKDKLLIAWLSIEGAGQDFEFSLKGRFFDGGTFGPVMSISKFADGWAEFSFSLATDGERIAAAFLSQNLSHLTLSFVPKLSVFDGALWSAEQQLLPEGYVEMFFVTPEFYRGKIYVAFDTADPAYTGAGDHDIFVRTVDPATFEQGELVALTAPDNNGLDFHPEMQAFGDKLYLVWQSSDDVLTFGTDIDLVLTVFNGTAWSEPREVTRDETNPNIDYTPHWLVDGDTLHLYWIDDVKPPGVTTKDQRIATRLIERGPRWWDGLTAFFSYPFPPQDGNNTTVTVEFKDAQGRPVGSPQYSVKSHNGSWMRLDGDAANFTFTFLYNRSYVDPFVVRACGKPLSLEAAPPPDDGAGPGAPVPGFGASPVVLLLAAAAVASWSARAAASKSRTGRTK